MSELIGKVISHYHILEQIGQGGMGVVCKAQDIKLDRIVALKFLPHHLGTSEEEKQRIIHEAKAASALDHPNICTIHEIDETEDGQMFIAMAYYDGESLKDRIERGPLPLEAAIDIAIQTAQGLSDAHSKVILHRDVKPANILITDTGQVKIVDFGLAKLAGRTMLTKEGTTLGTVAYMSPEQTQGTEVDHRTDIWALGAVLYEMITGQAPFKGDYEPAVMYSIMNEDPEPLTALRTGVPMELEQIVLKILAKNPEERYQHTDEVLTDLRRVKKIQTTKTMPRLSVQSRPLRRKLLASPFLWTLLIVAFGLAGGVLLFYPSKTISFSERDWILIADFENLTGEEVFEESLSTAFHVSIGQSKYLNVFPQRRIREALRRMKQADTKRIDEALAQEIAQREDIKVVLVPSISRVGSRYVLTTVIEDARTGESLQSYIAYAQGQEEVLTALDNLTKKVRGDLGEALIEISQQSKPLVKVTTNSLEALKQYSLAIHKHREGNVAEASLYYENALRIDSTFTAARASLGMLH